MKNTYCDTSLSRRKFLKSSQSAFLLSLAGCSSLSQLTQAKPLRMGIISDLHHGLEPTATSRLEAFIAVANERKLDCIMQLGDFNFGKPESRECMDSWERFKGNKYHVLGNHDMDFKTKEQMLDFWGMPGRYYSFDKNGYHFIVMDRNNLKTPDGYVHYTNANFYVDSGMRGHADPEQLEWLRADLESTKLPSIVFMHQGLGMQDEAYPKGSSKAEVEAVFDSVNRDSGTNRVVACFCGHHHLDRYNIKNGIHYVWINSASYYWVGDKYGRMAPYRDPLFAIVSFYPDGLIAIEGRHSAWAKPTPKERGYPDQESLTTFISDRTFEVE